MHRRTLSLTAPPLTTTRGRLILTCSIVLVTALVILITPKSTITTLKAHIPGGHPYVKPSTPQLDTPIPDPPATTPAPSKLIVKAHIQGEDLNWLLKLRPEWRNQVITLDASFAHLHAGAQRVDKGRIADAYLRWLITNYNKLGETIVFVPPGLEEQEADKEKWRLPNKEVVQSIEKLNVSYVSDVGFAPLRCPRKTECDDPILPSRDHSDEFRTLEVNMAKAWSQIFNDTQVPEKLANSAASAFAVSREQVRSRGVEEYIRYWEWLASTKMDDDTAGALVERLWHVIFGREVMWCPAEKTCQCEIFGEC